MTFSSVRTIRINEFWQWFDENKHHYFYIEDDWDPENEMLYAKIEAIDKRLAVSIDTNEDDYCQIFISAACDIEIFPLVREVVAMAPKIEGWIITAFHQRIEGNFIFKTKLVELDPSQMFFLPFFEKDNLDLALYARNIDHVEEEILSGYCYNILMDLVGEFDLTTKVRGYCLFDMDTLEEDELIPLLQLPDFIQTNFLNPN
jgi:hypothetical protein